MSNREQRNPQRTAKYALIQCIINMAYCCIINFAAVFLLARGVSNAAIGLTLTIANGLALITQPIIATFADKTQRVTLRQLVAGLLFVCGLAALLLMVTPALLLPTAILYILLSRTSRRLRGIRPPQWSFHRVGWLYVAQGLQFFAYALFMPASVYYVNQVIHGADKVKGQAGMNRALGISGMFGNFLGGFMLDTGGGVSFMLTVGLGVSLVGLVLILLLTERPKPLLAASVQYS